MFKEEDYSIEEDNFETNQSASQDIFKDDTLETLKNDICLITFSHAFLDTVLGEILDDFGLHLGMHFEAFWENFGHDFCKEILNTLL